MPLVQVNPKMKIENDPIPYFLGLWSLSAASNCLYPDASRLSAIRYQCSALSGIAAHTETKHAPDTPAPATSTRPTSESKTLKPETQNPKMHSSSRFLSTLFSTPSPHPGKIYPNPAKPHMPAGESRTKMKACWMRRVSRVERPVPLRLRCY